LKDKAFSIFRDQNPPLELRPENGISLSQKPVRQWPVIDNNVFKRPAKGKLLSRRSGVADQHVPEGVIFRASAASSRGRGEGIVNRHIGECSQKPRRESPPDDRSSLQHGLVGRAQRRVDQLSWALFAAKEDFALVSWNGPNE
jgi:hypothetical protein